MASAIKKYEQILKKKGYQASLGVENCNKHRNSAGKCVTATRKLKSVN